MVSVFLYPLHQSFKGSPNPYMHHFKDALAKRATIVNANSIHRGVINLFLYFYRTDVFILNWIEFLAEKKFGKIQAQLFVLFCKCAKRFDKKIIWILHNRGSHHGGLKNKTDKMFAVLMNNADHIITHSHSGLEFVKENYSFAIDKVKVIIHPVEAPFQDSGPLDKSYDLLIWGSVHPYKGIDVFLDFVNKSTKYNKYRILIIGKCFDKSYKNKISKQTSNNIIFHDKIYPLEEISGFASKSKYVLFTYKSETIISSGVLMDTLRMNTQIIGPDYAAFRDLNMLTCITTYSSFEMISSIIDNYDASKNWNFSQREKFHEENNWDIFAKKISLNF